MRIAWIGNSFIYFNELPAMIAALLMTAGEPAVDHGQVTPGGQRLAGHAADEKVTALLSHEGAPPWDVVILQDNSGIPGGFDADALAESRKALTTTLVPMVPRSARLILYGTWGHMRGSVYEAQRTAYPDYVTMQRLTTKGIEDYRELIAEQHQRPIEFAPVGDAFQLIYDEEVERGVEPTSAESLFARLFVPDMFHPSRLGSFLAASVFAHLLLMGDPQRLAASRPFRPAPSCKFDRKLKERFGEDWVPAEMSEEDAARLQGAARRAVEARASSCAGEHAI
jgi:hypothetical protein